MKNPLQKEGAVFRMSIIFEESDYEIIETICSQLKFLLFYFRYLLQFFQYFNRYLKLIYSHN